MLSITSTLTSQRSSWSVTTMNPKTENLVQQVMNLLNVSYTQELILNTKKKKGCNSSFQPVEENSIATKYKGICLQKETLD